MIQIEKLSLAFGGEEIFDEISFSIAKGERCGLVGRNGSGKSSLLRLIIGELQVASGMVHIPKGYRIGYLKQHIHFSEPTLLSEALLGLSEDEREHEYKAEKILFGLGFKESELQSSPTLLSGGYSLRLHLAKVLLSEPDCLLLDEPTNYLDIVSIRFLSRFLREWKGEFILITHDREFMDSVATHTLGIQRKKVKKIAGSTQEYFRQIVEEEKLFEKTRQNLSKKQAHLEAFITRFGAKASKASQAQSKLKMLKRLPVLEELKELYHLDFNFKEAPYFGKKMIEANDLTFAYTPTQAPVISHFSLSIENGDRLAIIGKNGRGKSTLLRLLAGELKAQTGEFEMMEKVKMACFGQTHVERLDPLKTVEEEIASCNFDLSYGQIKSICGLMMFSGALSQKKIGVLSGGEKSRVLLGKMVATATNLLFLDEPTHHLDIESIEALLDALEEYEKTIVIATHSELILRRLSLNKIVICHQGRQEFHLGDYDAFLKKGGWHDETDLKKTEVEKASYKSERRKRAEEVQKRSKLLGPIKREIEELEKIIEALRLEQKRDQARLIELAPTHSPDVALLIKEMGEREKKIEKHYGELEALHFDYAKAAASLEEP